MTITPTPTVPAPQKTIQQLHKDASSELSSIKRVSHRLAMTDASKLEAVLQLLLPRLLGRIGSNNVRTVELLKNYPTALSGGSMDQSSVVKGLYDEIRSQLVEILSHTIMRVRADERCKLPCSAILCLLYDSENQRPHPPNKVDPFTLNLSLAFLTLGLPRCATSNEVAELFPGLLVLLGSFGKFEYWAGSESGTSRCAQICHLVIRGLDRIVTSNDGARSGGGIAASSLSNLPPSAALSAGRQKKRDSDGDYVVSKDGGGEGSDIVAGEDKLMQMARNLCKSDASGASKENDVGAVLYDLLLDILLYQPTAPPPDPNNGDNNNGLPPQGLSQASHMRLLSGSSILEKTWYAEFASPLRLRNLKFAVLDFIAPCRRWDIFDVCGKTVDVVDSSHAVTSTAADFGGGNVEVDKNDHGSTNKMNRSTNTEISTAILTPTFYRLGITRVVSLLVVSSGDNNADVAERAGTYLKAHLESMKNQRATTTISTDDAPNSNTFRNGVSSSMCAITTDPLLGVPFLLACELLSLVLGGVVATNVLAKNCQHRASCPLSLGKAINENDDGNRGIDRTMVMSTKRRMVSQKCATTVLTFVSVQILDGIPEIFGSPSFMSSVSLDSGRNGGGSSSISSSIGASVIGILSLMAAKNYVGSKHSLTGAGTSYTSSRLNPRIASARLLNSLCIRLVSFYDIYSRDKRKNDDKGGVDGVSLSITTDTKPDPTLQSVGNILQEVLKLAQSIVSIAASHHSGDVGNPIGIEIRDAFYGVMCSIFRSTVVVNPALDDEERTISSNVSIETVVTLFGCVSNEQENLRPRAVAALDSLLSAYKRIYKGYLLPVESNIIEVNVNKPLPVSVTLTDSNPWASTPSNDSPFVKSEHGDVSMKDATNGDIKIDATDSDFHYFIKSLTTLLWNVAHGSQQKNRPKAARYAAAKWANDILKPVNVTDACHILCFLAGDKDSATSSFAIDGLGIISSVIGNQGLHRADDHNIKENFPLPSFEDIIFTIFPNNQKPSSLQVSTSLIRQRPTYSNFSPRGQGAALRFALSCLFSDLYGVGGDDNEDEGEDESLSRFIFVLCSTLSECIPSSSMRVDSVDQRGKCASIDLLDEACICLGECIRASHYVRRKISRSVVSKTAKPFLSLKQIAELAISANSSVARRHLSSMVGNLLDDLTVWDFTSHYASQQAEVSLSIDDVNQWITKTYFLKLLSLSCLKLEGVRTVDRRTSAGEVHGAALLGSTCVRSFRSIVSHCSSPVETACWVSVEAIVRALANGLIHEDEVIGNACARGLSIALSDNSGLDACRKGYDASAMDGHLFEVTVESLQCLYVGLCKYGNGDATDANRVTILAQTTGVVLAASTLQSSLPNYGVCITSGSDNFKETVSAADILKEIGARRLRCVDALFDLLGSSCSRKDPEVCVVVGDALAQYADAYSPEGSVWTMPERDMPVNYDEDFAKELPPHRQVVYNLLQRDVKATSPHKRTACAPVLLSFVGRVTHMVNNDSATLRRAFAKEILLNLVEFQTAFLELLADPKSKQLARESCCLGLAACRGLSLAATASGANKENTMNFLNERLLKVFGQTTNYGGSALMESNAQNAIRMEENWNGEARSSIRSMENNTDETEVGGTAGMGEAALGAYREMASAAVALGRPDVLYSLLILCVTLPIWLTPDLRERYSATSLLGQPSVASEGNTSELRQALKPHYEKLIPRLLRACNDPNAQTREQMTTLWTRLTGSPTEARALISQHLIVTTDTLIDDATNKLWRARVGACGALSEILVGRCWEELGGGGPVNDDVEETQGAALRLLCLYKVLTRCMDDVRISVRESAATLARSVRNLTIRLCDPKNQEKASYKSSIAASSTILPWLVDHGLNQPCAEAAGFAVSCLLGIVEVAMPETLEPVLPVLIGALLMAMSGLEPAALNYLQVRAAGQETNSLRGTGGYENLERMRLQMAQNGPVAGCLMKCLDMMKFINLNSQKDVIPYLDSAIRCGAGFATRAAAADAVSSLSSTCPAAFKFPGTSTMNPTVRLLRALYFASERERGTGARSKMAHALGNLAELAPGSSVRQLALHACERYKFATGSNDDPILRRCAAASVRAIATRALSQFSDGGANDIWFKRVLPLAYIGQHEDEIGPIWKEVWEEGVQATNSLCVDGVSCNLNPQEKLLPFLIKCITDGLDDVAWNRRLTACCALKELSMTVLTPLPQPTHNSSQGIKDFNIRMRRRAKASKDVLFTCTMLIVKSRLWDGKADLIKVTSKIAGNWASLINEIPQNRLPKDELQKNLHDNSVITRANVWDDLYHNDGWFIGNKVDENTQDEISKEISNEKDYSIEDEMIDPDEDDVANMDMEEVAMSSLIDSSQCKHLSSPLSLSGLCRVLLEEAISPTKKPHSIFYDSDSLPFRASVLQGLVNLLESSQENQKNLAFESENKFSKFLYAKVAPFLISMIDGHECMFPSLANSTVEEKPPPIIIARSIGCLSAAMWNQIHNTSNADPYSDVCLLVRLFALNCGEGQAAWSIREASALAATSLTLKAQSACLRKLECIELMLDCTVFCLRDKKFWRVRHAGLVLLLRLCQRGGISNAPVNVQKALQAGNDEEHLLLEALLPHKEKILKIARTSLSDTESTVKVTASDICNHVAWWP